MAIKFSSLRKGLGLFKDYLLYSEERYSALSLFALGLITIAVLVACSFGMQWWFGTFWDAFMTFSSSLLLTKLWQFAIITAVIAVFNGLKSYLVDTLTTRWRRWLTRRLLLKLIPGDDGLVKNRGYLKLARFPDDIDNPAQRIQEDIQIVTEKMVNFILDFISSSIRLAFFTGMLWIVGGSLTILVFGASFTIPGYLVWIAILCALVGTLLKNAIGQKLGKINNQQKQSEAEFRSEMEDLIKNAENVSLENGDKFYQQAINSGFGEIITNSNAKKQVKTHLSIFETIYNNIMLIFPFLVTAPVYFLSKINFGQLMKIGMAFTEVTYALSWFSNSYQEFSTFYSSLKRLLKLEESLSEAQAQEECISLTAREQEDISIENLSIAYPNRAGESTAFIFQNLNISIPKNESTVIEGNSGLGKSTFFKAIAGSWHYGKGSVTIPKGKRILFLAQKTTFPEKKTLKEILDYPGTEAYSNERYAEVLSLVNLKELLPALNQRGNWGQRLSGGQQQRVAFARALLQNPAWLFIDENTSNMQHSLQAEMYQMLRENLPETTMISIAHNPEIASFHKSAVTFEGLDDQRQLIFSKGAVGQQQAQVEFDDNTIAAMSV